MTRVIEKKESICARRTNCRLCQGDDLEKILTLSPTPPANALVGPDQVGIAEESFPLELFFCRKCAHVQMLDVVDPSVLFRNYVYVSGTSPVFVRHFERYAEDIVRRGQLKSNDLVVELGSNDGTLLGFFKKAGMRILGVDPAEKIAAAASARGLETWPEFFTEEVVSRILKERGSASVICANNVFAHIDDLKGIVGNVKSLMNQSGLFVFEVSYLLDVIAKTLFDTVYHEHLDYHSVKPLVSFFHSQGMELIEAFRVDVHGGSIRGIAQKKGGPLSVGDSVRDRLREEESAQIDSIAGFKSFSQQIEARRTELSRLLLSLKQQGKTIAGYGAPAKATTLMHHFSLGTDVIDFIVDNNPLKQGLFTPGLHVPIVSSRYLVEKKPDYILILAWNFAASIMKEMEFFRNAGGHFIVPLPHVEVI